MATTRTTASTSPNSCADIVTPGSAPVDPAGVAERLREVRERIARAGGSQVAVIAVTKSFPPEAVLAAIAAGADGIGENYAQELDAKASVVAEAKGSGCPVHFIGQLQSNKVRVVAPRRRHPIGGSTLADRRDRATGTGGGGDGAGLTGRRAGQGRL